MKTKRKPLKKKSPKKYFKVTPSDEKKREEKMMGTQKKSDGNVLLSFLYFRVSGIKSELEFR